MKSSVDEIRQRFDADVERFSDLETGQQAAVDSPPCLDLIAQAAVVCSPTARSLLDIGCGAGNYTLKYLQTRAHYRQSGPKPLPGLKLTDDADFECRLVDLSRPMLDRAQRRVSEHSAGPVQTIQSDVRTLQLEPESVDVILAAAVLHHLRTPEEWRAVFGDLYRWLRPGGSVWIYDMVESSIPTWAQAEKERYGEYLHSIGGDEYRDKVFAYIEKEDTPTSITYQLGLLREVGFEQTEVLHKRIGFAAFGAVKNEEPSIPAKQID